MTVHVLPDIERLLVQWALARDAVASLVDDRIYTAIPKDATYPLIRLTRIAGTPAEGLGNVLWLDQALIQWDVFGGPKATCRQIAETVRAHLSASVVGGHALGVVTAIEFGSFLWLPDDAFEPALPRYTFETRITFHP